MSDSKRLTIVKALTTLLQGVTPDNGYENDLSTSVFRGRTRFSVDEPVPAVAILEALNPDRAPDDAGGTNSRVSKTDWILLIQGWAEEDRVNPTDPAHQLLAEVKKRLARIVQDDDNSDYLLGGLVEDCLIEPGTVRPPDEESSRAYFWMRVVLTVVERLNDPFSLT